MRQYAAFPGSAVAGQEAATSVLFPEGAYDVATRPSSSCISASLNATVHLLNRYENRSLHSNSSSRSSSSVPSPTSLNRERDPFLQISPGKIQRTIRSAMAAASASQQSSDPQSQSRRKLCFVTVGATAPFDGLVDACQQPQFLSALESAGFTNLLIQHGDRGHSKEALPLQIGGIRINSFDFRQDGIRAEMLAAKGNMRELVAFDKKARKADASGTADSGGNDAIDLGEGWQGANWDEGLVISHAGSGSILDALRIGVPLIVVPNEELLDNHQVELADELAKQGYVTHGHLDNLTSALKEAEELRQSRRQWPPPVDASVDPSGKGLIGVMDEEMGYHDLKDSLVRRGGLHLD